MVSEGIKDRLSNVGKLKEWVSNKKKEERRNNIVLKGVKIKGKERIIKGALKEWVSDFLKNKLSIDRKVEHCKISEKVIIAKLVDEETKKEVMRNKNKLKENNIYIKNDLTWEEKKIQERISSWTKVERSKGMECDYFYYYPIERVDSRTAESSL